MVEIRESGEKGKGLYTSSSVTCGSSIFVELPLISYGLDKLKEENICHIKAIMDLLFDENEDVPQSNVQGISSCEICSSKLDEEELRTHYVLENILFAQKNILDDRVNKLCLYDKAHNLNHSCKPNAEYTIHKDGKINVYAISDIPEDEEITISYVDDLLLLDHISVREHIKLNMGFDCICDYCKANMDTILGEQTNRKVENEKNLLLTDPVEYFKTMIDNDEEISDDDGVKILQTHFSKFNKAVKEEIEKDENVYTNGLLLTLDCYYEIGTQQDFLSFINDNSELIMKIGDYDTGLAVIFFRKFVEISCKMNNRSCLYFGCMNLQLAINKYLETESPLKFNKHYVLFLLASFITGVTDHYNGEFDLEQYVKLYNVTSMLNNSLLVYYGIDLVDFLQSLDILSGIFNDYQRDIKIICKR